MAGQLLQHKSSKLQLQQGGLVITHLRLMLHKNSLQHRLGDAAVSGVCVPVPDVLQTQLQLCLCQLPNQLGQDLVSLGRPTLARLVHHRQQPAWLLQLKG